VLYAIHDALMKPMPNNTEELCLAESYTPSADGLSHEFVLRSGATFHNGETVTAEDVKFSFRQYRGNAARFLMSKVGSCPKKVCGERQRGGFQKSAGGRRALQVRLIQVRVSNWCSRRLPTTGAGRQR
jgi:ABC-type transport system substrate-binding protein